MAIPADSASKLAFQGLDDAWGVIRQGLEELYDPKVKTVTFYAGQARDLVNKAQAMGDEAAFEPRPWKMPWQSTLFDSVLEETRYMVATLAAIETSFAEDGVEGAKKCEPVRLLTERSSLFNKGGNTITRKLDIVRRLLGIFAHETSHKFPVLSEPEVFHTFREEEHLAEEEFVQKELPHLFGKDLQPAKTICHDEMAHMSMVLANVSRMKLLLRGVHVKSAAGILIPDYELAGFLYQLVREIKFSIDDFSVLTVFACISAGRQCLGLPKQLQKEFAELVGTTRESSPGPPSDYWAESDEGPPTPAYQKPRRPRRLSQQASLDNSPVLVLAATAGGHNGSKSPLCELDQLSALQDGHLLQADEPLTTRDVQAKLARCGEATREMAEADLVGGVDVAPSAGTQAALPQMGYWVQVETIHGLPRAIKSKYHVKAYWLACPDEAVFFEECCPSIPSPAEEATEDCTVRGQVLLPKATAPGMAAVEVFREVEGGASVMFRTELNVMDSGNHRLLDHQLKAKSDNWDAKIRLRIWPHPLRRASLASLPAAANGRGGADRESGGVGALAALDAKPASEYVEELEEEEVEEEPLEDDPILEDAPATSPDRGR
ncbi:unnamed protein product [Symbiodinium pilosum]|uniref:Uncharacterized protein n=1 Tax=Symbiodinium pilosum TaxID=2952 RepID=A0A812IMU3_SYMPI|nr:unnamed protein product [Symbiodinium pilosum]